MCTFVCVCVCVRASARAYLCMHVYACMHQAHVFQEAIEYPDGVISFLLPRSSQTQVRSLDLAARTVTC